ncbi:MAG: alanine--tRNA ligase [Dokdonella sp.]
MKTTAQIRSEFLEFFRSKEHTIVPSASLVPGNDPTLLFTNYGMVQFKDVFLGSEKRPYVRAADVQRCLRAGGKHNDLDQVGYTARHHTFFEMLGNWSFGDYFKRDAILWAWQLLTEVWKLPKDRLLVTVYHTDDEAHRIWHDEVGIPAERIVRIGDNKGAPYASDNFWQMADTGPCGPCTEIFYDHGDHIAGGPPGSPDEDGDRYIEIWNLVFMQFDRAADGSLSPLQAPCVDTGMGMERLAAILQNVHSNYEIDLFSRLIAKAGELTGTADLANKSLRVIADHIRACSFLIVDGVLPSNEGRGYVLRRIIRRALRHGWMLGVRGDFFWKMVPTLVSEMGDAYPDLVARQDIVSKSLKAEEERFGETLEQGMKLFAEVAANSASVIPGDDAFRLYDTYGFPVDLTADIARERGLTVDMVGFDTAMNQQRERARAAGKFESKGSMPADLASSLPPTLFTGYDALAKLSGKVLAIIREGRKLEALDDAEQAMVILDQTPFYAESGGQVGDTGTLRGAGGEFAVSDTVKLGGAFHAHVGAWKGAVLRVGDSIEADVDADRRQSVVLNHSATHLLHAALRKVLGEHVQQKGSLVAPDRLRFDFAHFEPMSRDELARVESLVNSQIRGNAGGDIHEMAYDEAIEFGALALFGEKYGDRVRVLKMGDFSTELCGGTHVARTGDIGLFKILGETGVASGVRRIEAVTGAGALAHVAVEEARLDEVADMLSSSPGDVVHKLRQLFERQRKSERELQSLKARAAVSAVQELAEQAFDIGHGVRAVCARVDGLDGKSLRDGVDLLKHRLVDCVVLLASGADGKAALVAGVAGSAAGRVKAGDLVAHVAAQIGGKGGGRADMAQGGGPDTPALDSALLQAPHWLREQLLA